MNEELAQCLAHEVRRSESAQMTDSKDAAEAKSVGDFPRMFDGLVQMVLADVYWSSEMWAEARLLYRHNAEVMIERRAWHLANSPPSFPIDAALDWEASTFVKAGELGLGREYLARAIRHWNKEAGSELTVSQLALHAAQAGLSEFAEYSYAAVSARQELLGGDGKYVSRSRKLLHYEPTEAQLLLGRWDQFHQELERLEEGAHLARSHSGHAYPPPLEGAMIDAARGFRAIASLHGNEGDPRAHMIDARDAFEASMLGFYRFNGWVDANLYFMRLNVVLAEQLASGRALDPTPFTREIPKGEVL